MLTRNGMCDLNVKAAHRIYDAAEVALCIGDDPADSMTMPVEEDNTRVGHRVTGRHLILLK